MIVVSSLNNKITRGLNSDISNWASNEDHLHYQKLFNDSGLVIMGSSTFEAMNLKANSNRLVIVLTRDPLKYQDKFIKDQLEFSSLEPIQLVKQLEKRGYKDGLLIGGSHIFDLFINAKLINYILLTIEPKLFSSGVQLFDSLKKDYDLKLLSVKKLNNSGTLLLKYLFL